MRPTLSALYGALAAVVACAAEPQPVDLPIVAVRAGTGVEFGARDAPVAIVEFGSYACAYCRRFQTSIWPELATRYVHTDRVRFLYREAFVHESPALLDVAATIACSARHAGSPAVHDWAFTERPAVLDPASIVDAATRRFDIDRVALEACAAGDARVRHRLIQASVAAESAGVWSVPTFIVGRPSEGQVIGWAVVGLPPRDTLFALIERALRSQGVD